MAPLAAAAAVAVVYPAIAGAQSVHTWTGGGDPDTSWSNAANWADGLAPNGNDEIHFAGTVNLSPFNDTTLAGWRIFFDSGAGPFTLNGNAITLFDFGGQAPKIENNSTSLQTVNMAITLSPGGVGFAEINPVNGSLLFGSTVAIQDGTQLRVWGDNGNTVTFDGVVSGTGSTVAINQNSNVVFAAANTYTGETFVNAGDLRFAAGGSTASSFLRLGNTSGTAAATLSLVSPTGGQTIANPINVRAGSSGVKTIRSTNGSGTNTLSGNVFLDADVTVSSDTAGGTFALTGTTIDLKNRLMTVGGAGDVVISGNVQNPTAGESGRLSKGGAGVLTLSGTNTYRGSTTISGGTVVIGADGNLGTAPSAATPGHLSFAGGALSFLNTATIATNRGISLGTGGGTLSVPASSTLTYGGVAAGSGRLFKAGAGTLTLTGNNTFTGGITVTNGILSFNGESTSTSGAATPTGAIPATATANFIVLDGGVLQSTRVGAGVTFLATNKGITLSASGGTLEVTDATAGNLNIYSGVIGGTSGGTLTKSGPGVLSITALQTYDGPTVVHSGTLRVRSTAERFPDSSALTINAAGTFDVGGSVGLSETMGSLAGSGTLALAGNTATFGGNNSSTTYSGQVIGAGGVFNKLGNGTLTIEGNDWANTGSVNIRAGAIRFGNSAAGFNNVSTLAISAGALLDMNGINDTIGALAGAGDIVNGANLTLASNNGTTYSGSYAGTGKLVKGGTGILTLSGSNGWAQVDFNDGRINFNNNGAAGAGTINVGVGADEFTSSAAGIVLGNHVALASGAVPKLYATSGNSLRLNGQISGAGGFLRDDTGAGTLTLNGDNTFSGGLSITSRGGIFFGHRNAAGSGTLSLGGASAPTNAISIQANTNLSGPEAMLNPVSLNQSVTIAGSNALEFGGTVSLGASTPTVTVTNSAPTTFSGDIGGPTGVGLTKAGAGVLVLSGTNTYSGGTTVNAGVLLANGVNTGTGSVNVNATATLGGTGSLAGAVNVNAGGTLAPGESVGSLSTGNLSFTANTAQFLVEIDIDANTADAVNVTGSVDLNGPADTVAPQLTFVFLTGTPPLGTPVSFTIIDNDTSADAVEGTFAGLANNVPVDRSGVRFSVNYGGGDGNDVVVTFTEVPEPGTAAAVAAGALALLARRRRERSGR